MANCTNCGAALPPDSLVCSYCNTRQDIDLKGIHKYTVERPDSQRICPRCSQSMPTIDIKVGGKFLVERCNQCMGMFFDNGELEAILEKSVSLAYHTDHLTLDKLEQAKRHQDYPVGYIKCPVCMKLMHRVNYGTRSGVIIDSCRDHGVWLDGGELRQLMDWRKAGGDLHHKRKELELEKEKLRQEQLKLQMKGVGDPFGPQERYAGNRDWNVLSGISKALSRWIR